MNGKPDRSTQTVLMVAVIAVSLFSALSLQSIDAQNQKTNQSQTNKEKGTNVTAPIGNVKQLSKALGNNTKILASNAMIGAKPNMTQPKITTGTPSNGLTSNPTKDNSRPTPGQNSSTSSGPGKV